MIPKNPCEGCELWKIHYGFKELCQEASCDDLNLYEAELRGIRKGAYGVVDMIRTSNKLTGFKNRIEISNNIVIELIEDGIERPELIEGLEDCKEGRVSKVDLEEL